MASEADTAGSIRASHPSPAPLFGPCGWAGAILACVTLICLPLRGDLLPILFMRTQDLPVLAGMALALLLVDRVAPPLRLPAMSLSRRGSVIALLCAALILTLLLWAGTYWVMLNYALTRDEHMVLFDGAVFASGHSAQPIAPGWRAFTQVLVPAFLLDIPGHVALVSSYLPGNALMRAGFARLADPALMNPLLAAAGALALADAARSLFPRDRAAMVVSLTVYLLSAQMIVAAMTVYAMTAHLALNCLWLAAFLRGGRWHGAALIIGAWAIGLHQPIFHPLFAGPFLLWRLARGEWRVFGIYALVYAVAGIGWIAYPALAIGPGIVGRGTGSSNAGALLLHLLRTRDPATLPTMLCNLVRFISWQHLALLPLMGMALPAARRNVGVAAPLVGGIVLATLAMAVLLPSQGYGWGYRYLHGFIGSAALLAGYGWQRWAAVARARAERSVIALTILTAAASLPWLLIQAHAFVVPFVRLDAAAAAKPGDFLLIDTEYPSLAIDTVRNAPDLSNRPLRLSSRDIGPRSLAIVCARGTISLLTRADMHAVGFKPEVPVASPQFEALVDAIGREPCLLDRPAAPRP